MSQRINTVNVVELDGSDITSLASFQDNSTGRFEAIKLFTEKAKENWSFTKENIETAIELFNNDRFNEGGLGEWEGPYSIIITVSK